MLQTKQKSVCVQADAKNWNHVIRGIGANFDIMNMASSDSDFSNVEASAVVDDGEGIVNEGLPSGSERDLIEYYFSRGFTYRQITLMLGKHHLLDMNERILKQRLKDYDGLRRRDAVNDELVKLSMKVNCSIGKPFSVCSSASSSSLPLRYNHKLPDCSDSGLRHILEGRHQYCWHLK